MNRKTFKKRFLNTLGLYGYLVPTIIGLTIFNAGAIIASFVISFQKYDVLTPAKWIGLENYRWLMKSDLFKRSIVNTLQFAVGYIPLSIAVSLILAMLVNQKLKGMTVFRTIFYLPVVTSMVAVSLVWSWLFNAKYGLINYVLSWFGITGPAWLTSSEWAMWAIVIVSVWKTAGYYMVIYLAALQNIPPELYEAADIDGAVGWHKFRHITLPLISPTTFFVLIMVTIGALKIFEQVYVMTDGGPANATVTINLLIFRNAFQFLRMGRAAAMAYVLFAAIMIVTFIQFLGQKRWVYYG
ncbi:MAG: sugar ABC transporter permease [Firmicutes bacterium]|nr:sugar ABC transporter permease [Bacillota bacterium]